MGMWEVIQEVLSLGSAQGMLSGAGMKGRDRRSGPDLHWLLEGIARPGRSEGWRKRGCQDIHHQWGAIPTSVPTANTHAFPSSSPAGVSAAPALSEAFALDGWISQPGEV